MRVVSLSRSALAVPVLLLGLAACGGTDARPVSGEPADRSPAVRSSAPASEPAPSEAAVSEALESSASAGVGNDSATGGGTWDRSTLVPAMRAAMDGQRTAHVSVTTGVTGMEMQGEADIVFRGARQDMVMTMDGAAFGVASAEIRMVDRVMYLSMPPLTPQGKFVEVRAGDGSSPFAAMVGQMQAVDPRDTFKALAAGLRKVKFVAEESVHGEDLEHYRLTVDFQAAAKALGMPRTAGVPRTIAYDLWLDREALMRRVEMELMQQASLVMETSDWGEPVTVEAPPRKDIVQAPRQ